MALSGSGSRRKKAVRQRKSGHRSMAQRYAIPSNPGGVKRLGSVVRMAVKEAKRPGADRETVCVMVHIAKNVAYEMRGQQGAKARALVDRLDKKYVMKCPRPGTSMALDEYEF